MLDFSAVFKPKGGAALTSAPMSAEEIDLPPGAPLYPAGPLGTMPPGKPSPTPGTRSAEEIDLPPGAPLYPAGPLGTNPLPTPAPTPATTLAAGGFNHIQAWMSGAATPPTQAEQKPFEQPPEQRNNPNFDFTWSSRFTQPPAY